MYLHIYFPVGKNHTSQQMCTVRCLPRQVAGREMGTEKGFFKEVIREYFSEEVTFKLSS